MALACLLGATGAAGAQDVATPEYFTKQLAPHGKWMQHNTYGRVWQPYEVPRGWRPYTHGRWVWTDEYGWYWASAFTWGWAAER